MAQVQVVLAITVPQEPTQTQAGHMVEALKQAVQTASAGQGVVTHGSVSTLIFGQ